MKLKHLIKAIENEIVKHPVTEHARQVGSTAKITENDDDDELYIKEYSYSDGTVIRYENGEPSSITTKDGNEIPFLANSKNRDIGTEGSNVEKGVPKSFDYISEAFLMEESGQAVPTTSVEEEGYGFETSIQNAVKQSENNKKATEIKENFKNSEFEDYIIDNYDVNKEELLDYAINEYAETVRTNSFENADSFVTLEISSSEDVTRGIVQNDSFKFEEATTYGFKTGRGWQVFTIREKGNPANCGVDLTKYTNPLAYQEGPDSPGLFMTAPGQKFENLLIDEQNQIIIRKPYQAGMERHIWG